jgi:hypothetical protein
VINLVDEAQDPRRRLRQAGTLEGWRLIVTSLPSSWDGQVEMAMENAVRSAVLVDADNAQASISEALPAEVAKYGTAHVKRL